MSGPCGHLEVIGAITVPESELQFDFVRASGPGGQNVNKVASAVQLRFDLNANRSLPLQLKKRLLTLAGRRVTVDGTLVIDAREYRSQARNRQSAVDRLLELLRVAAITPKNRIKTKPSRRAKMRILEAKRKRSATKQHRRSSKNLQRQDIS